MTPFVRRQIDEARARAAALSLSSDESATLLEMSKKKISGDSEPRPVGRPARAGEAAETRLSVRVTDAELEAWRDAAVEAEQSLGEWIRERCNRSIARSA